jgi:hypothetical protein
MEGSARLSGATLSNRQWRSPAQRRSAPFRSAETSGRCAWNPNFVCCVIRARRRNAKAGARMRPSRPCSSTGAPSRFEPPSGCLFRCPKDGGATGGAAHRPERKSPRRLPSLARMTGDGKTDVDEAGRSPSRPAAQDHADTEVNAGPDRTRRLRRIRNPACRQSEDARPSRRSSCTDSRAAHSPRRRALPTLVSGCGHR